MKTLKKLRDCGKSVDFMNIVFTCGLLAEFVMGTLLLLKYLKHTADMIVMTEIDIIWIMGMIAGIIISTLIIVIISTVVYEIAVAIEFPALDKIKTHVKDELSKLNNLERLLSEYGDEETSPIKKEIAKRKIENLTHITLDEFNTKATVDTVRIIKRCFKDFIRYIDDAMGYMIDKEFNHIHITKTSADIMMEISKRTTAYNVKHIIHTAGTDYEHVLSGMLTKDISKLNSILLD